MAVAMRKDHIFIECVSSKGLVLPCTFAPTMPMRVGIRYPKMLGYEYDIEKKRFRPLQNYYND